MGLLPPFYRWGNRSLHGLTDHVPEIRQMPSSRRFSGDKLGSSLFNSVDVEGTEPAPPPPPLCWYVATAKSMSSASYRPDPNQVFPTFWLCHSERCASLSLSFLIWKMGGSNSNINNSASLVNYHHETEWDLPCSSPCLGAFPGFSALTLLTSRTGSFFTVGSGAVLCV